MPMLKTPTKRAYDDLDAAYDYFNKQLFGSRLPPCLITVRPHRGAYGYFSGERFGSRDGKEIHDEIALNIKTFQQRSPHEILSTLVHEMVNLEQFHFGEASRNGYHNKQWASWMERIGQKPTDTGAPRGERTGERMTHYVIPDGAFAAAVAKRNFAVPYYDRAEESSVTRGKRKIAYTPKLRGQSVGQAGRAAALRQVRPRRDGCIVRYKHRRGGLTGRPCEPGLIRRPSVLRGFAGGPDLKQDLLRE